MTDTTDIAALMLDMRDLADRIVECNGENENGEEIIHLYDQSDTTFQAKNILLVLDAFKAERQRADAAEVELAALRGEQEPVEYQYHYHNHGTGGGEWWRVSTKKRYEELQKEHYGDSNFSFRMLFAHPPKPVVVLKSGHMHKSDVIKALEAAGIVVKYGD